MRTYGAGHPVVEGLESRRMLSAVPQPIADLGVDEALDVSGGVGGPTSVYAGGTVYFSAVTSRNRDTAELWKTDPATGQTTFIKSFSGPFSPITPVISNMAAGGGSTAYFVVTPSSGSAQIWRTDGTATGTYPLTPSSGSFSFGYNSRIPFVRRGNSTYFAAGGIWRVDDASPSVAKPVTGGGGGFGLTLANGTLYFLNGQTNVSGLYQINDAGTGAAQVFGGISNPASLAQNNGVLYFFGVVPNSGGAINLYRSDGTTAGTGAVTQVHYSTGPSPIVGAGANVYFVAYGDTTGYELWKSDGTAAGTSMVTDLNPGNGYSLVNNQVPYHGELYFTAYTGSGTGRALWKTDGTPEGTVRVAALDDASSSAVLETAVVGDALYFSARTTATGPELWRTDGTPEGTRLVVDQYPGRAGARPHGLIDAGGVVYYEGIDPVFGYGLFRSDGTAAGTSRVKDYLAGPLNPSFYVPQRAVTADGRMFYADGDDTSTGRELYVTDGGTAAGTRLVKDISPGSGGSSPSWLTDVNGTVYFAAEGSSAQGVELWKSDGTAAGTVLVKNIHSDDNLRYTRFGSNPSGLTNVNGVLYFAADDGVNGTELWRSDGTAAGTVMFDVRAGATPSYPQNLTNVNGTLFFMASGTTTGAYDLFKLAPGDAGPLYVQTFRPTLGSNSGTIPYGAMTNVNGTLFFAADDGTHGMELWKSDGTMSGTVMVKDIRTVAGQQNNVSSRPDGFVPFGKGLIFYADDGVTGRELWKSDGTAAGTVLVKDIYPNKFSDSFFNGSNLYPEVSYNGSVYFYASDGEHGTELWRTDGTTAGTVMVKDIRPGSVGSAPLWFRVVGGRLYFTADDGVSGTELWVTDGTDAGTVRVSDLNPGAGPSNPAGIESLNGAVVFTASDGVNGPTLYRFEPESVKPTVVGTRLARVGGKAAVVVDFDEDVSGSLSGSDLVVTNLTTGQALDPTAFTLAYDAANSRATFFFGGGVLGDGNYRVALGANGVRDTSDNPLAADGTLDFFVLAGDANGDRVVNFDDLLVLAKNYNGVNETWADGDFNGDGVVNFDDLLVLAKNYNKVLDAPPPPPPAPAPVLAAAAAAAVLPKSPDRQARAVKPVFSTRPVVARPAAVKAKKVTARGRRG